MAWAVGLPAAEAGWAPPHAPGSPQGAFVLLTQSAQPPRPVLRLNWPPAEPGDYLIAGYQVYRSTPGGEAQRRGVADALVAELNLDDPVEIGQAYAYRILAVDARGLTGPASVETHFDLRALPAEQLAPPAPSGVTAASRRNDVLLSWDAAHAWVAEITGYRVWRADSVLALSGAMPLDISGTSLVDAAPVLGQPRWYAVASVDAEGRVSAPSLTVSALATGTLPPGQPLNLSMRARTERVALSWESAPAGTAPVSGYVLQRRAVEDEEWRQLAKLAAERRDYTDRVPGDRGYIYALAAFDSEGNTGTPAYVAASPSAKLLNKTLIITMPTAYANHKGSDRGLNLNVIFDFYVGSLFESYTNPITEQSRTGTFQPLQIGTVSTDTKLALLDDRGLIPGLAAGLYISALINFGQPTGAQTIGVSSSGSGGIATLGNAYAVLSKRFWPGEPRAMVHGGLLIGGLANALSEPLPSDWQLTARHLLPGGDLPTLMTRFLNPKLGAQVAQAPHMAFGGIQVPFTIPLIFTQWRTGLRLEYMAPLPMGADYAPSNQPRPDMDPSTQLPWMLNVHVDNLPLFGFEFGYFHFPGGFQLIAFYHIPDLTWSW